MTDYTESTDYADNTDTTGMMQPGDRVLGEIGVAGDSDWVRAALDGGYGYYFYLTDNGGAGALGGSRLTLRDGSGDQIGYYYDSSGGIGYGFTANTDATYFADVQAYRNADVGSYILTLQQEIAGTIATVQDLDVGGSLNSTIDYGYDHDFLRVSLDGGYGYVFRYSGDGGATSLAGTSMALRNDIGESLGSVYNRDGATTFGYTTVDAMSVYLDLSSYNSNYTGDYTVSVQQEIAGGLSTMEDLAVGGALDSAIDYGGDADWVRTELSAGYGYVFDLIGDGSAQSLGGTYLRLRDDTGEIMSYDYGRSGGSTIGYTANTNETVYASLEGYSSAFSGSYTYTIRQEVAGDFVTFTSLTVGTPTAGRVDYDRDDDMFRVTLAENVTYDIGVTGDGGAVPLGQTRLTLYDGFGEQVDYRNTYTGTNGLTFTPDTGGTYFVKVTGYTPDAGYLLTAAPEDIEGGAENDRLTGTILDDMIIGGNGADTISGFAGNDTLLGGGDADDLRDVIYGGDGNDSIDGGYGNDELRGDAGMDTITGGFGVDDVFGGDGNDVLTGQAWSDLIFGGNGDDFINGGFGFDRVNGGDGADRFFHLGIADHGSDWIQDYTAADGDVLVFGAAGDRAQFQVNFTETANAGAAGVEEAFVIYRPTGQILWALVDGAGQAEINIVIGGAEYDLLV